MNQRIGNINNASLFHKVGDAITVALHPWSPASHSHCVRLDVCYSTQPPTSFIAFCHKYNETAVWLRCN